MENILILYILGIILFYTGKFLTMYWIKIFEKSRSDVCIYGWEFSNQFLIVLKIIGLSLIPIYNHISGIFCIRHSKLIADSLVSNAVHLPDPSKK